MEQVVETIFATFLMHSLVFSDCGRGVTEAESIGALELTPCESSQIPPEPIYVQN